MSGISAIYFLDKKGKPIIFRNYRGEVSQNISDNFQRKVLELEETNMKPIFTVNNVHYAWIKHTNIYIVAVSKRNPNLAMIFSLLRKMVELLINYFNVLDDESIRDNFVLIYELLDECIDHGYPQNTDVGSLKEYIKTESNKSNINNLKQVLFNKSSSSVNPNAFQMSTSNTARREGIIHKENRAYLDVVEKVNSLISCKGEMLRSEIVGVINMNPLLSGMPLVKLGLNDKIFYEVSGRTTSSRTIEMDDLKFHNCVNMNKFENERVIEFIPPDSKFQLMSYRLNTQLKPLIWVEVRMKEVTSTRWEYSVVAKSNYKSKSRAVNVEILIPVPNDLQNPTFKTPNGKVVYQPDKECVNWIINYLPGQMNLNMKISFTVPTLRTVNSNSLHKPIQVKFEIPSYTVSGIQVKYLKITERSGYQASPYVKYVTMNGEYQIRMV